MTSLLRSSIQTVPVEIKRNARHPQQTSVAAIRGKHRGLVQASKRMVRPQH
jgi:hypothetical protein